jgi:hypothetical protein
MNALACYHEIARSPRDAKRFKDSRLQSMNRFASLAII